MRGLADLSLGRQAARRLADLPADPEMPVISTLLRPADARRWWREWIPAGAGPDPAALGSVTVLRYRPGRRCTLRLEFGRTGTRRLYVKIYRSRKVEEAASRLRALALAGPWPDLCLPAVLACVPRQGVVVLEEIAGKSWDEQLENGADQEEETTRVALALARFHSLNPAPVIGGPRRWSTGNEMRAVHRFVPSLIEQGNVPRDRVEGLLARLEDDLAGASFGDPVLLHGDLHPQQIVLGAGRTGLVDLDEVAMGPPEIDLGNLLAHLDLYGLYLAADVRRFGTASRRMVDTYSSRHQISCGALGVARAASLSRLAGLYAGAGLPDISFLLIERAEGLLARRSIA